MRPRPTKPTASASRRTATVPRRQGVALVAAILLAIVVWRALSHAGVFNRRRIPDELIGHWTTTQPGYADRALEFKPDAVIFSFGEQGVSVHPVYRVARTNSPSYTGYVIEYVDGDQVSTLSLRYVPSPLQVIRLANQRFVWRKQ